MIGVILFPLLITIYAINTKMFLQLMHYDINIHKDSIRCYLLVITYYLHKCNMYLLSTPIKIGHVQDTIITNEVITHYLNFHSN